MKRLLAAVRVLSAFAQQSIGERISVAVIFAVICLCAGLVGAGFFALLRAVRLLLPVLVLACFTGCASLLPPCQCVCAPAPDPRVRDLQAEVDRGQAEIARLRERLAADAEAGKESEPVWIFPKVRPEGGVR